MEKHGRQNNGKTRDSGWNVTRLCVLTRGSYSLLSGLVSVSALGDFEPADLVWEPCCVVHMFLAQEGFYAIDTFFPDT